MNKALLLDPFIPSISEVSVGDFKDIQRHIGCDVFTCVRSAQSADIYDFALIQPKAWYPAALQNGRLLR